MAKDIHSIVPPAETAEQFATRQKWDYRVVLATGGRTTRFGAIILAILGKSRATRAFGPSAMITASGNIVSRFTDKDGNSAVVKVCDVDEFVGNLSTLADHLQLSDEDRIALFAKARAWISSDARANKEPLHFTKTR